MTKPSVIRAALDAATPGPWRLGEIHWHRGTGGHDAKQSIYGRERGTVAVTHHAQFQLPWQLKVGTVEKKENDPNAELIAAAPGWLRELLDENERLRAALRWFRDEVAVSNCDGDDYWIQWETGEQEIPSEVVAVLREVSE